MDRFLIDYLKSGEAWVFVGSGPSIEMGYPTWKDLASEALHVTTTESRGQDLRIIKKAFDVADYPKVFEEAKIILGAARLLQCLREVLKPSKLDSKIYEYLARWPVPVYLTTNYDNEILNHLAKLKEPYNTYMNMEDHISFMLPKLNGAIFKLHGDLRSESGLILTKSQYWEIDESPEWRYWRTKLTSTFQMCKIIVVGHSLSDPNVKHVIKAAKEGSTVDQPICWIAPDVDYLTAKEYLENYRIRVITYDNRDGTHRNLVRLIENINDFIPPRIAVHIKKQIAAISQSPLGTNAAAPGFYVFNKLATSDNYDTIRVDIVVAAIQSTLSKLHMLPEFDLVDSLEMAGWPKKLPIDPDFAKTIVEQTIKQGLLESTDSGRLKVAQGAEILSIKNSQNFEHMRERFKTSLKLRIQNDYLSLGPKETEQIVTDIEAALTGYFREGGLSLATTLFAQGRRSAVPYSILRFITEASARYDDLLSRQAFVTASVGAFSRPESADREYLGRVAQGFFAFHALGVFGDAALERLRQAKETVWLLDSDVQIVALALGAPTNNAFARCILGLHNKGIRLFTTKKLFVETLEHLWFANKVIKEYGPSSTVVMAAAMGQTPYRKSNQFLEGFIRWQTLSNRHDWGLYMYQLFGSREFDEDCVMKSLQKMGVEVVDFEDWPGFAESDFAEREKCTEKITEIRMSTHYGKAISDIDEQRRKSLPEAEVFIISKKEQEGKYYIISKQKEKSINWFISHTSILNIVEQGFKLTWLPEAFLCFVSTLGSQTDADLADAAFEGLMWSIAQSGLSLLAEREIKQAFSDVIDQAVLDIKEQNQVYGEILKNKYSESPESVMRRLNPIDQPLAAIQFANETAEIEKQKRAAAERAATDEKKRANHLEKELESVERYRKKMEAKKERSKSSKRKPSKKKKKKKK